MGCAGITFGDDDDDDEETEAEVCRSTRRDARRCGAAAVEAVTATEDARDGGGVGE